MNRKTQSGVTFLELVVVVIILGILASIAVPAYQTIQRRSDVNAAVSNWQESFYLAQAEAMRVKREITFCASKDGTSCDGSFDEGWIVIDINGNNRLIRDELAPKVKGLSMYLNNNSNNRLVIRPNGNIKGFVGASLIAEIKDTDIRRVLVISKEGRMRVNTNASTNNNAQDNDRWE